MPPPAARMIWFERSVAVVYSTVAVLGLAVVALTIALYLVGADDASALLP